MSETEEFSPSTAYLWYFVLAVTLLTVGISRLLWFGTAADLIADTPLSALCIFAAVRSRRPYACLFRDHIAVNLAPLQSTQEIPWSSVRKAEQHGPSAVNLFLSNGKSVKLNPGAVWRDQRELFLAALVRHLEQAHVPLG